MHTRTLISIALAVLFLAAAGCSPAATSVGGDQPLPSEVSPQPPSGAGHPAPQPLEAAAVRDNLHVGIRVSPDRLNPGETAAVEVSAENFGTEAVPVEGCGPGIHLIIEGPEGATLPALEEGGPYSYCAAIMDVPLEPGQRIVHRFEVQVPAYPDAEPAPPGPYVFRASLRRGPVEQPPPPLEAEVTVMVGAGAAVLPRAEARARAEAHPEVHAWLRAHSGDSILRQDADGQWWINWGDALAAGPNGVPDELGIWHPAASDPAGQVPTEPQFGQQFRDGHWEFNWAMKFGLSPHRVRVQVHAQTGEVVRVEFFDR